MATPSPNPGGRNRSLMRTAFAQWLTAMHISGLDHVYRSQPPDVALDRYRTGAPAYVCQAWIRLVDDEETQLSMVGPTLPTGKLLHYNAELSIWHRSYEPSELDWAAGEDDFDRIVDGIKDALRGPGRQLGRPESVFTIATARGGLRGNYPEPEMTPEGSVDRYGTLHFVMTQVI